MRIDRAFADSSGLASRGASEAIVRLDWKMQDVVIIPIDRRPAELAESGPT